MDNQLFCISLHTVDIGWYNLLEFAVIYYILTFWTYGLSVPSGLFVPCILTGAAWGRLLGQVLTSYVGVSHLCSSRVYPKTSGSVWDHVGVP